MFLLGSVLLLDCQHQIARWKRIIKIRRLTHRELSQTICFSKLRNKDLKNHKDVSNIFKKQPFQNCIIQISLNRSFYFWEMTMAAMSKSPNALRQHLIGEKLLTLLLLPEGRPGVFPSWAHTYSFFNVKKEFVSCISPSFKML